MVKALRYLVKKFYILCAVVLIGAAVVVQAGRSLAPLAERYPDQVAEYLSEQLNLEVSLGAIHAHWEGLKPRLSLRDIRIRDLDGYRLLVAEGAELELDLLSSALRLKPVWGEIELHSAHLLLTQSESGTWGVPGPATQQQGAQLDDVWSLVQLGTRVEFHDTRLRLAFANGERLDFIAPHILLENHEDFHRLSAQVDIAERAGALKLVIEGQGNPSDSRRFHTQGHLELSQIPLRESVVALEEAFLGESERGEWVRDGRANARLWFDSLPRGEGYSLRGHATLEDLTLPIQGRDLRTVSTKVSGQWMRDGRWQMALQELSALWGEQKLPAVNMGASLDGPKAPVQIMMDRLELGYWADLVDQFGLLGDGLLQEVLQTLKPRGHLHHVQLTLPREEPQRWELAAELNQVSVDPWQNVPGFTNVSGYLAANQSGGTLDLDSRNGFGMFYEGTYDAPMGYQRARGQVAWHLRPEDNRIYVNSGPLTLAGERESARGSFWLAMPWQAGTDDIDLYIQVATEQMAAPLYAKYLPAVLPPVLTDWLHSSLARANPGRVTAGDFVFRGTLSEPSEMARSHQLYLAFERARLKYDSEWPALTGGEGQLWLDDSHLNVQLTQAQVYNSRVHDVEIGLAPNAEGEGLLLIIDGQVDGIASDGLRLLRESALQRQVGRAMDGWYMHGDLQAELSLAIPLQADQPGARQVVTVDLDVPRWAMDHYDLEMRNLKGRIRYTDRDGLSADALQTTLFGEPLSISIASQRSRDEDLPQTLLSFAGAVHSDRLLEWSQQPAAAFLRGNINYRAQVELTHRPETDEGDRRKVALAITSDLEGVAVDLPAPYGKGPATARPTHLNMVFGTETSLIDLHYGDLLQALVQLDTEGFQLRAANLALGEPAQLPTDSRLHLSGSLDRFDWPRWQSVWDRYNAHAEKLGHDPEQQTQRAQELLADDLQLSAQMRLGQHQLGGVLLEDIDLGVSSEADGWSLNFANDTLQGNLQWFNDQRPLQIELDYLRLAPSLLTDLPTDSDDVFDPRQLPAAEVMIDQFTVEGEDYGHWSFHLVPGEEGIRFDQIIGEVRGLHLSGLNGEQGAVLDWYFRDDGSQDSHFAGFFHTQNMGEVMRRWGQPDLIESQRASYRANLSWAAPPWGVSAEKLVGDVVLELDEGRFVRNPAGGSDGILRLFAVLNFDALARRLRLDFSDLYQSGLAYDSIRGRAFFNEGQVEFREPLLVRSPSSRMQLVGRVDLLEETLDARLVATLPVAGNLTFLTALVGGLPAAAGVFIVSKLFERQMDQATSIRYRISGDWDEPRVKFDRLFEGDMTLSSAKEK
ncbi:YhdP family protein [Marinimicrobium sp. ABcell2]|uniref:YhdP family protein n=1 Tax=Marinimicrobium sp. ABcell2 TaxID=3069751 RepID=UPI0027B1CCEB|nr:YhdP family protein [Marinimicrobium sp. ABcell2]MDQ2075122.1 YhdP family protein [Marinimicrobium sp. ABcell2]